MNSVRSTTAHEDLDGVSLEGFAFKATELSVQVFASKTQPVEKGECYSVKQPVSSLKVLRNRSKLGNHLAPACFRYKVFEVNREEVVREMIALLQG